MDSKGQDVFDMYVSMTGFSRTQRQEPWGVVTLEISSVNHRYQEISVILPHEFIGWEPWFHQQIRKLFRRGKVQLRIDVMWTQAYRKGTINSDILTKYINEINDICVTNGLHELKNPEMLLNLPGVIDVTSFGVSKQTSELCETFKMLLQNGVESWHKMRAIEGSHLKSEILMYLNDLEKLIVVLEEKWELAKKNTFNSTRKRITEKLEQFNAKLSEDRYIQELVIMADKWDISEEIARLKSHIKKFRLTGDENNSIGRKLDFIVQEMNREVNTLDSKIADAEVRWIAVDSKAVIECIREQIQNLE